MDANRYLKKKGVDCVERCELAGIIVAIIAGLIHIIAYWVYTKQIFKGESRPEGATWFLWAILATFHCVNYIVMTQDWIKGIVSIISSVMCIAIFLIALFKKKLSKIDFWDKIALLVGIVAGWAWWHYRSAIYANLILQIYLLISFSSTYRSVWKNSQNEKSYPWFLWSVAYILSIIVVVLRWEGQYQDFISPVHMALAHGCVAVLSLRKTKTR